MYFKIRKFLQAATRLAVGVLVIVLFRWTPTTGRGIIIYVGLFLALIVIAILVSGRKHSGYWPERPDDR